MGLGGEPVVVKNVVVRYIRGFVGGRFLPLTHVRTGGTEGLGPLVRPEVGDLVLPQGVSAVVAVHGDSVTRRNSPINRPTMNAKIQSTSDADISHFLSGGL